MNLPDDKREELAATAYQHRPLTRRQLPPLLVSGCTCGWGSEVYAHSAHLADALAPLIARWIEEGEAGVRARVEAVLDPVTRGQYVSGRRGGKTFLGQFVAELYDALETAPSVRSERPAEPPATNHPTDTTNAEES